MRIKLLFLFILNSIWLHANMASPVNEGTFGTRPFISQYVHILHENLHITLHENFQYADFVVEYNISAEKSGMQIPLLFYASSYYENFKVSIDGKEVTLARQEDFWDAYGPEKEKLTNFHYLYNADRKAVAEIENQFNHGRSDRIYLNDFLYFETDILEGNHTIKVTYTATNWRYNHSRLNEDSFRYALAPAKYWKSFGKLNVTIDATKVNDNIEINLGTPKTGNVNGITSYEFDKLPLEVLQITRIPTLSGFTKFLMNLESFWLAFIFISIIIAFHVWQMFRFRKKYPKRKFSTPAFIGASLIPICFIFLLIITSLWIDASIGEPYASGRKSYGAFFSFLYLPKYIIYYVVFSIVLDFILKRIFKKA